jgi:hypothetical protein
MIFITVKGLRIAAKSKTNNCKSLVLLVYCVLFKGDEAVSWLHGANVGYLGSRAARITNPRQPGLIVLVYHNNQKTVHYCTLEQVNYQEVVCCFHCH